MWREREFGAKVRKNAQKFEGDWLQVAGYRAIVIAARRITRFTAITSS